MFSLSMLETDSLVSRDGLAVTSRVCPLILNTWAESIIVLTRGIYAAFREGVHVYRQLPNG